MTGKLCLQLSLIFAKNNMLGLKVQYYTMLLLLEGTLKHRSRYGVAVFTSCLRTSSQKQGFPFPSTLCAFAPCSDDYKRSR